MIEPVTLSLVVIKTANLEAVAAFYRALGLPLAEEQHGTGPRHYAAQLAGAVFEVYPLSEGATADTTTRLGFTVPNLSAAVEAVRTLGARVAVEPQTSVWGERAVVQDPDGRSVELYQRD